MRIVAGVVVAAGILAGIVLLQFSGDPAGPAPEAAGPGPTAVAPPAAEPAPVAPPADADGETLYGLQFYAQAAPVLAREAEEAVAGKRSGLDIARHLHRAGLAFAAAGEAGRATELWNRVAKDFPNSAYAAEALFELAGRMQDPELQRTCLQRAAQTTADGPGKARAALKLAEMLKENGDLGGARAAYAQAYRGGLSIPEREAARQAMVDLNKSLLFGKSETADKAAYKVNPGDSLARISSKFGVAVGILQKANGLTSTVIHPGQVLMVPKGKISIEVVKEEFLLCVLYDGSVVKFFTVATGKDDQTPEGTFKVDNRIPKPTYYKRMPEGRIKEIPFGDPDNVLGTRWMGFASPWNAYGIHGTWEEEKLGMEASLGCIRMKNADVEELFDWIPAGTEVVIHR